MSDNFLDMQGKTVLITGGTKGIGLTTAKLFVQQNARVIITGRDLKFFQKMKIDYPEMIGIPCDISKVSEIDVLYQTIKSTIGNIDCLFVNAGISDLFTPLKDVTEEFFDKVVNTNLKGAYFSVQKSLSCLNDNASIILNASTAGVMGSKNHSIYSITKAALIHASREFAAELGDRGIRVNAVAPGLIETSIWDEIEKNKPHTKENFTRFVPLKRRFASAEEVAKVVLFLASDASSYITGETIIIDGGLSRVFMTGE